MDQLNRCKVIMDSKRGPLSDDEKFIVRSRAANMKKIVLKDMIDNLKNKQRSKTEEYFYWYVKQNLI